DDAIAEIREVVGLRALVEPRLLGLDEVSDVRLFADVRFGSQVRKGSDLCALADGRWTGENGVRLERRAVFDDDVGEHAADVDGDVRADARRAAKNRAR